MQFVLQEPPKSGGEEKRKENFHAHVWQKSPKNGGEEKSLNQGFFFLILQKALALLLPQQGAPAR